VHTLCPKGFNFAKVRTVNQLSISPEPEDHMTRERNPIDLEAGDELLPVTRETSRGGNEPPPEVNDRPEQNVAYDEVVKGGPLSAEERDRAKRESPLSD
jgi:hypothetical protein